MFRNFKESFPGRRKTDPRSRENHGPANHRPDAPKITTHPTREVVFVPTGAKHDVQKSPGKTIYTRDPHQPITPGTFHLPEVKEPIGNGKGTSKEALSRAKKHSRKQKKNK